MQHGYWYLATPYALYPHGKQAAYEAALEQTAYLLSSGIPVYSPIVHNHPLSLCSTLKCKNVDFDFWVKFVDQPLMDGAGGLIVSLMPSWEKSIGIKYEIDYFQSLGKPTYQMLPFGNVSLLPSLPRNLDTVLRDSSKWADKTFPLSTSSSRAAHLLREAKELQEKPEDSSEIADVLLLTAHLAMGERGPSIDLSVAADEKLAINKSRKWGQPDSEGVVEHLRVSGE